MPQLHLPSKAAGPYFRRRGQILKPWTVRDERIARVLAFRDCSEVDAFGKLEWDIFQAVDCKIDAAIEQRLIDFLSEQSLASDIRQGNVENLITRSLDGNEFNVQPRPTLFQFGLGPIRLPQCERAAARAEPEARHGEPESAARIQPRLKTVGVYVARESAP